MEINFKKGYSLIEILVYVIIFSVISILVINSLLVITKSFAKSKESRELMSSAVSSMERMTREIRSAQTINAVSAGSITLTAVENSINKKLEFYTLNNDLLFEEDDVLVGSLLMPNVRVTSLTFTNLTLTKGQAVKISMTLEYNNGNLNKSEIFYNTIFLRGSL